MNRPQSNGSSNTTMEILTLLTVFGSAALTLFSLELKERRAASAPSREESEARDEE